MIRGIASTLCATALALALASCTTPTTTAQAQPHNVIIFVADGLRYGSVNEADAAGLAAVRRDGVDFANSHSVYPTLTTVNAAALATGHSPGDHGDFANAAYPGEPWLPNSGFSRVVGYEDDAILADMDARFGGNYLHETGLLAAAQARGYNVASVGKAGPTGIQMRAMPGGGESVLIDEELGSGLPGAPALPADYAPLFAAAHLSAAPPPRGRPNRTQQEWFTHAVTDVLLPRFQQSGRPFLMVVWMPDPDSTQHSQTDSLGQLTPGINGPSSRAAIAGAASDLQHIRDALAERGLDTTTDIIVIADHGFTTISKQSQTSYSATRAWRNSAAGQLPPGFLAIDLSHTLGMNLYQANGLEVALDQGVTPRYGAATLGPDYEHPHIIVAANGGTDLIYLPADDAATLAPRIVQFLTTQDYVGGVFTADSLGPIAGALPLSAVNLNGAALPPQPAILVSFRSSDTGCGTPEMCTVEIADTPLQQGQGMHGSLSRGETRNFMAAIGPDFRARFVDPAPVSNADVAPTVAHIMGLDIVPYGTLRGRVISEALPRGRIVAHTADVVRATPAANGFQTLLNRQHVGETAYFDAAGAAGRAVGVHDDPAPTQH
jgi:arylsulfatase A-like enzyme